MPSEMRNGIDFGANKKMRVANNRICIVVLLLLCALSFSNGCRRQTKVFPQYPHMESLSGGFETEGTLYFGTSILVTCDENSKQKLYVAFTKVIKDDLLSSEIKVSLTSNVRDRRLHIQYGTTIKSIDLYTDPSGIYLIKDDKDHVEFELLESDPPLDVKDFSDPGSGELIKQHLIKLLAD